MLAPTIPSFPFVVPNGDVILRSSDGQDFSVVKAILTIASPFFNSLFSLPQPAGDESDVPTISVSEDSTTLDTLLHLCYLIKNPIVEDLELAASVLAAVRKYEMDNVIQDMCRVLVSEKTLETEAVRVYAIACQYKLVEEARSAAIASLRGPIEGIYIDEFETLPVTYYLRLLEFRRRVEVTICDALHKGMENRTFQCKESTIMPTCPLWASTRLIGTNRCGQIIATGWKSFISERVIPCMTTAPLDPSLFSPHDLNIALRRAEHCSGCKTAVSSQWLIAVASLRDLISKHISTAATETLNF